MAAVAGRRHRSAPSAPRLRGGSLVLALGAALLLSAVAPRALLAVGFVGLAAPTRSRGLGGTRLGAEAREAEVVVVGGADGDTAGRSEGDVALMKLEAALVVQIQKAKDEGNPDRVRDLARLLVLAKTAEGIAIKEGAKEVSSQVKTAIASYLTEFTGKEDYEMSDVTDELLSRCQKAVAALDDIYIEDIAREMTLAGEAAVVSFTGKEEYEFGDISKEVAARASSAVTSFIGKEEYKFGDITKEVLRRGGDAVSSFTGKEEYKFGDITRTMFKKIFGSEEDKKK